MTRVHLGEDSVQCPPIGTQHAVFCVSECGDEESPVSYLLSELSLMEIFLEKQHITQTGKFRNQILSLLIIILIKKKN